MTISQKQNLLQFLGYYTSAVDGIWGAQSIQATKRFQADFGLTDDGEFGQKTEDRIRQAIGNCDDLILDLPGSEKEQDEEPKSFDGTFWDEIEYFIPDEMKCKCGGKYCSGYPYEVQPLLMRILDRARRWSGHPIQIVSGLRCETHNRNENGVWNSQHMFGEAADVYFCNISADTALAWLQSQPDVRYAYRIEGCSNIHFDIHPVGR